MVGKWVGGINVMVKLTHQVTIEGVDTNGAPRRQIGEMHAPNAVVGTVPLVDGPALEPVSSIISVDGR